MNTCLRALAATFFLLLLGLPAQAQDAAERGPQPDLEPQEAVAAMLLALQKDSPEGVAQLYEFSSPRNREQTGPLERFTLMILTGFPEMLGHKAARHAPPLVDGDRAMIPVQVISTEDELSEYVFIMSRQHLPDCMGCWMCDAVVPPEALGPDGPFGGPGDDTEPPPGADPA